MRNQNYKNLDIYKLSRELVILIYTYTKELPDEEYGLKGLSGQIRRASVSVVSNIAEGSSRKDNQFLYFLTISLGSLREVDTQMKILFDLNYIDKKTFNFIIEKINECLAKLTNFMKRLNEIIIENNYNKK